jgi:hypothetical protein
VALLGGVFDVPRLTTLLLVNESHSKSSYSGGIIHSWNEADGKEAHASFVGNNLLVSSKILDSVKSALDVINRQKPSLEAEGSALKPLIPGDKTAFCAAAANLLGLKGARPGSQSLKGAESLCFASGCDQQATWASMVIVATNDTAAVQIRDMALGMKAFAQLQNPESSLPADAIGVAVAGARVTISFECPNEVVISALATRLKQMRGKHARDKR